jgi:hypothetical protein
MPTIQDSGAIISSISSDLADNNAGLISAHDVRHNMEDAVASIPNIVSLSDTENTYYFRNNVKVSGVGATESKFITEAGIAFPNAPVNGFLTDNTQVEPYPGAGNIDHGDLAGLSDDDHLVYLNRDGSRGMNGNLQMSDNLTAHWIGPFGDSDEGIQFVHNSDGQLEINTSGTIVFDDGSKIANAANEPTAKGLAKAWCNFDASGDAAGIPSVRSSYNIDSIERQSQGVIKITFASGTFSDNNYVAIGNSNANASSGNYNAFDVNTVGLLVREGDDATTLRSIYYVIRSDDNELVDAKVNDFVAYGLGPGTTADATPTTTNTGP